MENPACLSELALHLGSHKEQQPEVRFKAIRLFLHIVQCDKLRLFMPLKIDHRAEFTAVRSGDAAIQISHPKHYAGYIGKSKDKKNY